MGKNNHNNNRNNNKNRQNSNQQKPPRYTGKNVDPYGDVTRMERHAVDIFRDMNRGKYNPNNIVEFMNRDFVIACISAAQKNIRRHDILKTALNFTYPNCSDPDVVSMKNTEMITYDGWMYVHSTIIRYMNTGDLGVIVGLISNLSNNRDLRL